MAVQTKVGSGEGTFCYAYTDHLGNITALSWTGGTFVPGSKARYDPFGVMTTAPTTNPSISSHGFTGHRHNNTGPYPTQNLGLIYMNARYYLPEVGRFISPDTIVPEPGNPQSFNRYSYVNNNPVNNTDPSGHTVCTTWGATVLCGFWQNVLNTSSEAISLAVQGDLLVTDRVTLPPSSNDVTSWLAYQLTETPNSEAFQSIQSMWQEGDVPGASVMWARHVATSSSWDFKTDLLDIGIPDGNREIALGGNHVNYQVVANVFYGYIGRAIGMGEGYLQFGAGIAQVENGIV